MRAYLALCNAVMSMPRGSEALLKAQAVDRPQHLPPLQASSHFDSSGHRAALLTEPVLTEQGWIVPNSPDQLVNHVDQLRHEAETAGEDATSKAALRTIIHSLAERDGVSALRAEERQLGALEKRLSTARKAITNRAKKVPPKGR